MPPKSNSWLIRPLQICCCCWWWWWYTVLPVGGFVLSARLTVAGSRTGEINCRVQIGSPVTATSSSWARVWPDAAPAASASERGCWCNLMILGSAQIKISRRQLSEVSADRCRVCLQFDWQTPHMLLVVWPCHFWLLLIAYVLVLYSFHVIK